jgi:hypothetical protein
MGMIESTSVAQAAFAFSGFRHPVSSRPGSRRRVCRDDMTGQRRILHASGTHVTQCFVEWRVMRARHDAECAVVRTRGLETGETPKARDRQRRIDVPGCLADIADAFRPCRKNGTIKQRLGDRSKTIEQGQTGRRLGRHHRDVLKRIAPVCGRRRSSPSDRTLSTSIARGLAEVAKAASRFMLAYISAMGCDHGRTPTYLSAEEDEAPLREAGFSDVALFSAGSHSSGGSPRHDHPEGGRRTAVN